MDFLDIFDYFLLLKDVILGRWHIPISPSLIGPHSPLVQSPYKYYFRCIFSLFIVLPLQIWRYLVSQVRVSSICTIFLLNLFCAISAMAGGGNFIHRVISYVANELIVNGLSNSASFQRFAVRTSKRMEDLSKMAQQKRQEIADQVKDVSKNFESFKDR
ncbi:hypothetical protein RDI58_025284 [Solanum bulbocastanum]